MILNDRSEVKKTSPTADDRRLSSNEALNERDKTTSAYWAYKCNVLSPSCIGQEFQRRKTLSMNVKAKWNTSKIKNEKEKLTDED